MTQSWRSRLPLVFNRILLIGVVLLLAGVLFPRVEWIDALIGIYSYLLDVGGAGAGMAAFCLILAVALMLRKRRAWVVWLMLLGVQLVVTVLAGVVLVVTPSEVGDEFRMVDVAIQLLLTIVLIGLSLWGRGEFDARTAPGNWRRAISVLLGGFALSAGVGAVLALTLPAGQGHPSRRDRLLWLWERLSDQPARVVDPLPHWASTVVSLLLAATMLTAFWVLLRSQNRPLPADPDDELRLRALIACSDDSLAYFASRRDKSWCFSPDGSGAVAYRVVFGTCLAAGDPLGPRSSWPEAIKQWRRLCRTYGWVPAVIGASEPGAAAYHEHSGLRVMRLGDEAVLYASEFHLDAPEMKPVRKSVHRLHKRGYRTRIRRQGDLKPREVVELRELVELWRGGDTERGFSMALGRLGDPMDAECLVVEALFPEGEERDGVETAGILTFVPWGRDGYSLDYMRRNPQGDNGVVELLVTELMASGQVRRVSLNFAVFRAAFEEGARIGAGPFLRLWRRLLLVASRWWQLESLYRSNVKYRPHWEPRFLCFTDSAEIARVGAATGVAEGFVDLPGLASKPVEHPGPDPARLPEFLPEPTTVTVRRPEQVQVRETKRAELLGRGVDPYPPSFRPTQHCADIATSESGAEVTVAARVLRARWHGGVAFLDLRDWFGDCQVILDRSEIDVAAWRRVLDLGDHVGVRGTVGSSRTGTRSLIAQDLTLTSKATRPLPDKWRGFSSPEKRVRQRYLDLVVNPGARQTLVQRSRAIQSVRSTLLEAGYLEVETPILQTIHGGANARPFRTHMNAYDLDLYLRIAPELYLKRLLVGGVDRVFEMGRNFRNEGADATHNPEFSMLEAYHSYADYTDMRHLTEDLIRRAVLAATGGTALVGTDADGGTHTVDIAEPFGVTTVNEAISVACGREVTADTSRDELLAIADACDIAIEPTWTRGNVLLELYENLVEARTIAPTFYCDFPAEVSPLTRPHRDDSRLAERWDLVAFGAEIGTAYSEMVDPVVQRERLTEQSLLAAGGDPEAMEIDEDFLVALEHGMPPAGGLGLGLDRLVMLITHGSIRDVLPFPLVRPERAAVKGLEVRS